MPAQVFGPREENKKQNNLPLWPSPRTSENTQAAWRNEAGPRWQFCRQTNAAVKKARAEPHIMQSSPPRARRLAACWRAFALSGRTSGPAGRESLGPFPQARQAAPAARSEQCRYAGRGTAPHLRAPAALPALHRGACDFGEKHLLGQTADGPRRRRERGLQSPPRDKEKSFCFSPADGALLHKSA